MMNDTEPQPWDEIMNEEDVEAWMDWEGTVFQAVIDRFEDMEEARAEEMMWRLMDSF